MHFYLNVTGHVPIESVDNKPALVHIMALSRTGYKQLVEKKYEQDPRRLMSPLGINEFIDVVSPLFKSMTTNTK